MAEQKYLVRKVLLFIGLIFISFGFFGVWKRYIVTIIDNSL